MKILDRKYTTNRRQDEKLILRCSAFWETLRDRCANSSYARSLLASPLLPKGEANAKGEGSLALC